MTAKTPRSETLSKFAYEKTKAEGVYHSYNPLLKTIPLICLNDLSNAPQNAFVKCFASQKKEKLKAFNLLLKGTDLKLMNLPLEWFLTGLWKYWFSNLGEHNMAIELTPEQVTEIGKVWGNLYLSTLGAKEVVSRFQPQEILSQFQPQEILSKIDHQEILKGLSRQEVEDYLQQLKEQEKNQKS